MPTNMKIEPRLTLDGSLTLYHTTLDEHYHSTFGAIQESEHVFIHSGLRACEKKCLHVLEVGFGTGLNCFLTVLECALTAKQICYTAIEKYPLPPAIWQQLNYGINLQQEQQLLFERLHQSAWNRAEVISANLELMKMERDLLEVDFSALKGVDLVYFDAFSPDKQPELWERQVFDAIFGVMNEGGILVTYCAKGVVRRTLQAAGFRVERIPGPPGKREMIRAEKRTIV